MLLENRNDSLLEILVSLTETLLELQGEISHLNCYNCLLSGLFFKYIDIFFLVPERYIKKRCAQTAATDSQLYQRFERRIIILYKRDVPTDECNQSHCLVCNIDMMI